MPNGLPILLTALICAGKYVGEGEKANSMAK